MGNHYIPRYYLKGFTESENSDHIWVYDKELKRNYRTNINNVAQQNRYYSKRTERYLSEIIEGPANFVIDKIRKEKQYSLEDKWALTKYICVLLKRVPNARRLANKWYTEISKIFPKIEDTQKIEFEKQHIWEKIFPPGMTPDVCTIIFQMKWNILFYDKEDVFFTCDNPIYFPLHLGLGDDDTELTFPLSTKATLLAHHSKEDYDEFKTIDIDTAKEINNRTEHASTRFLYFSNNLSED